MDIEKLIEDLQEVLDSGQAFIPEDKLVEMAYGKRAGDENRARKKIIYRIIRAKREAGFPRNCNFFDDVWPVALSRLNLTNPEEYIYINTHQAILERNKKVYRNVIMKQGRKVQALRAEITDLQQKRFQQLNEDRDEIERLRRKVEHLSKNKCMGCLDAVCDDCDGQVKAGNT
jgi:hypothetical protein